MRSHSHITKPFRTTCFGWVVLFSLAIRLTPPAWAETRYVDVGLSGHCLSTYDPETRSCGSGSDLAYDSVSAAVSAAAAGDELVLREGTYAPFVVNRSGSTGLPIIIRAFSGEHIIVTGNAPAITLEGRAFVTIEGLAVQDVQGFARIYASDHVVIRNCSFARSTSSGTSGAVKLNQSSHCRIVDSIFADSASDMLVLQDASDHNLIRGNTFGAAAHSQISIRCSEFNVVRGNTFANPDQKCMEIYDCEGTSDAPVRLNATAHNLIESNAFTQTRASTAPHRYNAIQHGAQQTIVRRNVFRTCLGGGVNYQHYSDESLHVHGNRMYSNTFYQNQCHGIIGQSGPASQYFDNRVINNLLYLNTGCGGGGAQTSIEDSSAVVLINNALAVSDPGFVDAAQHDFRLLSDSPHVDAAIHLTTASSAGTGLVLPVADSTFFSDGFGIEGEPGDLIQLGGQSVNARILNINYATHTLTLDTSLSWTNGQPVHPAFIGSAPDMGAFEYGEATGPDYPPPGNFRRTP